MGLFPLYLLFLSVIVKSVEDIKCHFCGELNQAEFNTLDQKRRRICNKCRREQRKTWISKNPERQRLYQKTWRKKHLDKCRELSRNGMRRFRARNRTKENERITIWRKEHPQEWYRIRMKYHYKNMDKYRCQASAFKHYPESHVCEIEGCLESGERHHDNYNEPLKIRWLCRKHHKLEHGIYGKVIVSNKL